MKRLIAILPLIAVTACAKVHPGNVGVMVSNYGSNAGVDPSPKGIGWYYTGMSSDIYEFPVSTQTHTWSASKDEGGGANEEISFQDKNGLGLSADVGISYHVDPSKAPLFFQKYRMEISAVVDGPLRNTVRNAIIDAANGLPVEDIYGARKQALIMHAQQQAQKFFEPYGLVIEQLYWASNIRLPDTIHDQIQRRVANEQAALAAQASVATVEAEGRQKVAAADAAAKATEIEAAAIRTNPEILRQRAIEKWDGKLPTYMGSGAPVPFLGDK
jgi:regulator of protease activity HflC (stomatin/prohibitin superfamily)